MFQDLSGLNLVSRFETVQVHQHARADSPLDGGGHHTSNVTNMNWENGLSSASTGFLYRSDFCNNAFFAMFIICHLAC
jgi:hypothetical protein